MYVLWMQEYFAEFVSEDMQVGPQRDVLFHFVKDAEPEVVMVCRPERGPSIPVMVQAGVPEFAESQRKYEEYSRQGECPAAFAMTMAVSSVDTQSSQYPSKNYNYSGDDPRERYNRKHSPNNSHEASPSCRDSPRYSNKSSYIDRSKERYSRGIGSSPGKKVNHGYPGTSATNSNNGHHSNQDSRTNRTVARDPKERDHKAEVQKSALRVCGDWSEHTSSSGKKYYYNCKTEVSQWEKPKEWVDQPAKIENYRGSERPSSSKDSRYRHSSGPTIDRDKEKEREKRERASNLRKIVETNVKPDKQYLFEKLQASQSKMEAERAAAQRPLDQTKSDMGSHGYRRTDSIGSSHTCTSTADYSSSASRRYRRDSEGSRSIGRATTSRHDRRHDDHNEDMDISPDASPTSSRPSSCAGTPQIAPGSTPASLASLNTVSTVQASSALTISNIPRLITQLSGGQNNQELTQKALQTLQKLQEALSRQIAAAQSSVAASQSQQLPSVSPRPVDTTSPMPNSQSLHKSSYPTGQNSIPQSHPPTHSLSHPQTHPHSQSNIPTHPPSHQQLQPQRSSPQSSIPVSHMPNSQLFQNQAQTVYGRLGQAQPAQLQSAEPAQGEETRGSHSPRSHYESDRTSCCSPAPSETSSRGADLDPEALSAAADMMKDVSSDLTSSLHNYYNENLTTHVMGWQADHAEKQANRFREQSLTIDSIMCSQVSVELKRARSFVRLQEIQSTLQEQRNLFLAQQVHELENMKPPSTFLSSS